MNTTNLLLSRLAAAFVGLMLLATACSADTTVGATESVASPASTESAAPPTTEPTTAPTPEPPSPTPESPTPSAQSPSAQSSTAEPFSAADVTALLDRINTRFVGSEQAWPGFDLEDHPTIIRVLDKDRNVRDTIAINHPAADKLGDATPIDSRDWSHIQTAHRITDPIDAERLARTQNFEFSIDLGGIDSFVINLGGGAIENDRDFPATLVHEIFHRWQDQGFVFTNGNQNVDGYNYDKENIELAMLENEALIAGLEATTESERKQAARHFAALRLQRRTDDRVRALDDNQERYEGTARFIEHVTASEGDGGHYDMNNFTRELGDPALHIESGVKDWFGFGRFYSSGAAAMRLAELLGADDARNQVAKEGAFPADLVIEKTGVGLDDVDGLVEEARATYDPNGELAKLADGAKEQAASEDNIFDEDVASADGDAGLDGDDENAIIIGPEEEACLIEAGVDFDDPTGEITLEQAELCFPEIAPVP
jgi:hypothetical protein